MAVVLGETEDRYLYPHFVKRLSHHPYLSLASIGDDEVGELLPLVTQAVVATHHHLVHRGIVIRSLDGLDVEESVVLLGGDAALKDDTGGHRLRSLDIGVIEALHVPGERRQTDRALQVSQDLHIVLGRVELLRLQILILDELIHIVLAQVQDMLSVAPLRD